MSSHASPHWRQTPSCVRSRARHHSCPANTRMRTGAAIARASHAAQVQSRIKKLDKIEKLEPPRTIQRVDFEFKKPARSGDDVIHLDRAADQPVDLVAGGRLFARAEVVVDGDRVTLRIVEIVGVMRWPEMRSLFTPADDVAGNVWYLRDTKAIAAAKK